MTTTTTQHRTRERLYSEPPGVSVYSPAALGPSWGRRSLAKLHRVSGDLYDLYLIRKDGVYRKHPVKVPLDAAQALIPDPKVLWSQGDVPEDIGRAKKGIRLLPTSVGV